MARSYSGVIADTSLEERRASVFRHAENTVSNKGMKERAISGFIINSESSPHYHTPSAQDWLLQYRYSRIELRVKTLSNPLFQMS